MMNNHKKIAMLIIKGLANPKKTDHYNDEKQCVGGKEHS